ncbi:MAG: hypothetical protein HC904_11970 [Blastochloris sp.]|nr:hypothetical protein [Blastochloris sp.]
MPPGPSSPLRRKNRNRRRHPRPRCHRHRHRLRCQRPLRRHPRLGQPPPLPVFLALDQPGDPLEVLGLDPAGLVVNQSSIPAVSDDGGQTKLRVLFVRFKE